MNDEDKDRRIAALETQIDTYNTTGVKDADAMAEKYLEARERIATLERKRDEARRELADCISACQEALGQLEMIDDALEQADPAFLEGDRTVDCVGLVLIALAKERVRLDDLAQKAAIVVSACFGDSEEQPPLCVIRHADWLKESTERFESTLKLWREGRIPVSIEGFMLETNILHMLRCIHGSNLRAALHLLKHALYQTLRLHVFSLGYWKARAEFKREEK